MAKAMRRCPAGKGTYTSSHEMIRQQMYSYKSGIPLSDQAAGGFDAGTNLLQLAPSPSYAEQLACALTKPLPGEYAIMRSTNERASEVIDQFRTAGADKHFVGMVDTVTRFIY